MKKSRLVNIVLTLIMLINTVLTPQISYAISDNIGEAEKEVQEEELQEEEEKVGEVLSAESPSGDEGDVAGDVENLDDNSQQEEPANITAVDEGNVLEGKDDTQDDRGPPAEGTPFAEVEINLLTGFEMTFIDKDGQQSIIENGADIEVDLTNTNSIMVKYDITKPDDVNIAAGDTYTIDLPEFFDGSRTNEPITVEGIQVATYSIVNRQVIITFNEAVNEFDDIEMSVELSGNFETEVFETEEEVVVNVPFQDGNSYTVIIRPEQQEYDGTDKKEAGNPYILNDDGSKNETNRNPEYVDWTVRANDSAEIFDQATIIDDLGDNLEIVEESFVAEKIIRNYNNEEIGRETVDIKPTITDSGFELNLGEIDAAYDISYTTRLIRPDGGGNLSVNNSARIILDGTEKTVSDNVETSWSSDLPVINKEGQLSDDPHVINWQVEYNYGEEFLGEVTLTDVLSHGEILPETVQVYEVNPDIDGKVSDLGEPTKGFFPLSLDADGKAYYITFSSTVPVGLNENVVNTISDDLDDPNSDDASVPVNTIPTGGKVGEQSVDENGRPYIDWTITMNSEKINVESINVIDVFDPVMLEFEANDESLYTLYQDGEEVDNFTISPYEHDDGSGRAGFELTVQNAGPHEYKFVYRTYYTVIGMQQPELANDAKLIFKDSEGIGIGETVGVDFDLEGPKAGIDKSGKYVLNEETGLQEIEWSVTFNDSKIMLEKGSTLTDTFTTGNYTLIEDSLKLTTDDGNDIDYTATPNDDGSGFVITLNEETNSTITVQFRTTADDTNNLDHVNDATLEWQGGTEDATATVGKRDAGITKYGDVVVNDDGTKTVNWEINFNTKKNVIHNFKLTDKYTPTTVELSDITIKADDQDVTDQFTISPERTGGTFTVETDKLDAVEYQLTYSTTLSPEEEAETVRNEVDITYTGGTGENAFTVPSPTLGVEKHANGINREAENPVISWTIQANTDTTSHGVNLVDAVLEDTIPADQKLVKGTVVAVRKDNNDIKVTADNIKEEDNS